MARNSEIPPAGVRTSGTGAEAGDAVSRDAGSKPGRHPFTAEEFAGRFQASWHTLWLIAAAVLSDRAGADDVLQESAMIALGKLEQFDPGTNFTAWMGRIVRFVALNHGRRRSKLAGASTDPRTMESIEAWTGPARGAADSLLTGRGQLMSDAAGEATFDDRVMAALRGLDETARACLLLRTILEMPYREISIALDIAEGTAMSHVHRARATLRERLSDVSGIDPHSSASADKSHESGVQATSDTRAAGGAGAHVNGRKRGEMGSKPEVRRGGHG